MRKTIVQGTFRLPISHPFSPGGLRILYQVLGLTATPLVISLLMTSAVHAQGPYCFGFNCTANDVQHPNYFINDVNANDITSIVFTPGQLVTHVYPWLTFQGTVANYYDIHVVVSGFSNSAAFLSGQTFEIQADSFSTITLTSSAPGNTGQCAWTNLN